MRNWVISCLLATLSFMSFAQSSMEPTFVFKAGQTQIKIEGNWQYWEDQSANTTLNEVFNQPFQLLNDTTKSPHFGFSTSAYWLRLNLKNEHNDPSFYLHFSHAVLDHIEFYFQDSSGHWIQQISGDRYPVSSRAVHHRTFAFPFTLPKDSTTTLYVRVLSTSSLQLPAVLWKPTAFHASKSDLSFIVGLYYGAMLIMAIHFALLFFFLRNKSMLLFALMIATGTNIVAFFQGTGFFYVFPEWPEFNHAYTVWSGPIFIFSAIALAIQFLQLKSLAPTLRWILIAHVVANVLLSFAVQFYLVRTYSIHQLLAISSGIFILVSAIQAYRKGYAPSRFFLWAWVVLFVSLGVNPLRSLGWIPLNFFTENIIYYGSILEVILISFAIADRIRFVERQNIQSSQRALDIEKNAKINLEIQVRERTKELTEQKEELESLSETLTETNQLVLNKNQELEEINEVKNKLLSVLSHDLKAPLNTLKSLLTAFENKILTEVEFKQLAGQVAQQMGNTQEMLNNLLLWVKTQLGGEYHQPDNYNLIDIYKSVETIVLPDIHKKELNLELEIPSHIRVFADKNQVEAILRNLIGNAIKFTPQKGIITVGAAAFKGMILVSVSDSGVGLTTERQQQLFKKKGYTTAGTHLEKGTGIGLSLCKEFVEQNGGNIWVESQENQGSVFYFTLPSSNDKVL